MIGRAEFVAKPTRQGRESDGFLCEGRPALALRCQCEAYTQAGPFWAILGSSSAAFHANCLEILCHLRLQGQIPDTDGRADLAQRL